MLRMTMIPIGLALSVAGQAAAPPAKTDSFAGSPFADADANKDGNVTRAEFVRARQARFDRIDKNKDGVIDPKDFPKAAFHPQLLAKIDQGLAVADTNGDGNVSRAELARAPTPLFDKVDANHDGVISSAEADRARQAALARKGR